MLRRCDWEIGVPHTKVCPCFRGLEQSGSTVFMCIHTQVVLFQGRYHLPYALHTASVQVPYSGKLLRDKLS